MGRRMIAVIAFDALCFDLVAKWAAEGRLPNFATALNQACCGRVGNPTGLEAGAVWPTFCTGVEPGWHGQYEAHYKFDTDLYRVRPMARSERHAPPFWVAASDAGRRVAVVDVPYAFLEPSINGVQVVDWLTHVLVRPEGLAALPADLAEKIAATYGVNPFGGPNRCPTNDVKLDSADAVLAFRDRLLDRVRWKTDFTLDLLTRERWDLLLTTFHDAHDVGHMAWHLHDRSHERHDPDIAAQTGNPVLDVYMALDVALGRLLASLDGQATVLIYLSHGMGIDRSATRFLDDILRRLELAYRNSKPLAPTWLDSAGRLYRSLVPAQVRRRLVGTKFVQQAYTANTSAQARGRSFFELAPNHATGGVRFNLKGRESGGVVDPADLLELSARLERDLAAIINAESGERLIDTIVRTSAVHPGPYAREFPDLLLEWNKRHPIRRIYSPLFGELERHDHRVRTGDHTQKVGAFLALGAGIRSGRIDDLVRASDFAPTIAALLGLPPGAGGGRPIDAIVDPPRTARRRRA
jgi:predicted AlkP superfamily phosphohydrolase/phosphomutase